MANDKPTAEEIWGGGQDVKCVEVWSAISQFAGARLSDFTTKFDTGGDHGAPLRLVIPVK